MAIYYLLDNLTINKKLHKRYTISQLAGVSDKSLRGLVEQARIREIHTPPLATFEPLQKHVKLLESKGIMNLGDFAFADLSTMRSKFKDELIALQAKVKDIINPELPLNAVDCGCGESPGALETAK